MNNKPIYDVLKRIFDIIISFASLIVLFLPLLLISLIVKLDSKGPVFFKQKRVGKDGKFFYIIKFRSMYTDTNPDAPTHKLTNATSHITKFGAFMRKTSIDELPQLINIFLGDMSFVGPRPALWNQVDLISEREKYHAEKLKPGLTGLAQVSGRDELSVVHKAKIDGDYVLKRGFLIDIYIIIRTIVSVFKHDGIVEGYSDSLSDKETKE